MKIIVTGGAGFIGSHVADAYVKAGHRVAVIDDLSSGARRNVNPRAKFYRCDIRDARRLEVIFKKERPDAVSHHAALISVVHSASHPTELYETNVLGTLNALSVFGRHGKGGPFIFPSSAAVYGDPKRIPTPETAPLLPLSPYGLSKAMGEEAVRFAARTFGFPCLILRYANVYGPRQSTAKGGVIAVLKGVAARGGRPVMYGNGKKTRDYVYVSDVARANMLGLAHGKNETLNIGTGAETTDGALFEAVMRALDYRKLPMRKAARPGEIRRSALDPRRAKRVLGWSAKVKLEEGIRRAVA